MSAALLVVGLVIIVLTCYLFWAYTDSYIRWEDDLDHSRNRERHELWDDR